jgi:hypothetical protein
MAYATGKKQYEVGFNTKDVLIALDKVLHGGGIRVPTAIDLGSRNQPREIVPYLNTHFRRVFSNAKITPVDVLQSWLKGKEKQRISPIEEETLRAYVEDCAFYADHLGDLTQLDDWVKHIEANLKSGKSLTQTEQRRWDSYKIWLKLELQHRNTTPEKQARGQLFTNLKRTLEVLLEPSS